MTSVLKVDNIQNSSGTSAISIDDNGVVTKPVIPAFFARNSTATSLGTEQNPVIYNTTSTTGCFNQGGHYSTTTGKFTAPVAGIYCFSAQFYSNNEVSAQMYWYVNSGVVAGSQVNGTNDESAHEGLEMCVTLKLSANDTVHLGTGSNGLHQNLSYSYFCGHLVG